MVISSSNRSPSPMSMRPNPNLNPNPSPNSRNNQEREGVAARKSFNGYPFAKSSIVSQPRSFTPNTPVNSPAEYARRNSIGRESGVSFGDHEQKENERDPNLKSIARVRSPSISKGTKNFMSPTISAASKINPSPRKKVLGERNEAIRTSASLSEGKFHFFSTNSLDFTDEFESKSDMEVPPCSTIQDSNSEFEKKVAELSPGVGKIELESDLVILSPEVSLKTTKSSETLPQNQSIIIRVPEIIADNNTFSSPSIIAPLDADPSYQPYDPKNNFLSPRPQFLHYKPNPRIESYINEGLKFEDDLTSDSASVTETSEEVQSENSQEEQEEESSSSVGTSSLEENPSSIQQLEDVCEPKIDQTRGRFCGKWKTVTLLFFILLGFISFSMYSPGVGKAIYQENIFSQIYSKENFNDVLQNAKLWSVQSVGYLSQMIYKAREVQFSPLPLFSNLTEDYVFKGFEWKWKPLIDRKEDGRDDHEVEKLEQSSDILPLTDQVIEYFEQEDLDLEEYSVIEDEGFVLEEPVIKDETENQETDNHAESEHSSDVHLDLEEYSMIEDEGFVLEEPVIEDEIYVDETENQETDNHAESEHSSDVQDESMGIYTDELTEETSYDEPETQEADKNAESEHTSDVQDESMEIYVEELTEEASNDEPETQEADNHVESEHISDVQDESNTDEMAEEAENQEADNHAESEHTADEITEETSYDELENQETDNHEESEHTSDTSDVQDVQNEPLPLPISKSMSESSQRNLTSYTAAVSLAMVSLSVATAFMLAKKLKKVKKQTSANHFIQEEKPVCLLPKADEQPSSGTGPVEVDMIGESILSEMSSFQKTSSDNKRDLRARDEAQSIDTSSKRNYKRESLASSSSEYTMSESYGSFTTYSIMHPKNRDDEVVTPVRRSNRIRGKVTSP